MQLGMLDPVEKDKDGLPLTCRAVFVIGPDKKLRLSMLYPATTGRNFEYVFVYNFIAYCYVNLHLQMLI